MINFSYVQAAIAGIGIPAAIIIFFLVIRTRVSESSFYDDYNFSVKSSRKRKSAFSRKAYCRIKRVCGEKCRIILDATVPSRNGHFFHIDQLIITPKGLLPVMNVIPVVKKKDRILIKGKLSEDKWNMEILSKGKQKVNVKITSFALLSEKIIQTLTEYLSELYEEEKLETNSLQILTPVFLIPKKCSIKIIRDCNRDLFYSKLIRLKQLYGKKELIGVEEEVKLTDAFEALEELYLT